MIEKPSSRFGKTPICNTFSVIPSIKTKPHLKPQCLCISVKESGLNSSTKLISKSSRKDKLKKPSHRKKKEESEKPVNQGQLILDATCAPGDISYPYDLKLLEHCRKQTEKIIDCLNRQPEGRSQAKPRTYRKKARKEYLKVARQRRPSRQARADAIQKQLQYLQRNLGYIDQYIASGVSLTCLKPQQYKNLLVVSEIYRQQQQMWATQSKRIDDRIVSLTQPHIRPIVRGKAGKPTEFGAKLSVSCFENYVYIHRLSWDNFNESVDLQGQIENYKNLTGYYPSSVHVDKIYRTRENRAWCKERGIRISGPPLGRPPKNVSPQDKKQAQLDERIRNTIEGKFGQAKRRYGLSRILTKLRETSETAIGISFLLVNLSTLLRQVYCLFLSFFLRKWKREVNQLVEVIFSFDKALLDLCFDRATF